MGARWYVIQAKYDSEFVAAKNLTDMGFEVFLPTFKEKVIKRGKEIIFTRAFYPGYLFVKFDTKEDRWGRIKSTRGVKEILGCTETSAASVQRGFVENLIEAFQKLENPDKIIKNKIIPNIPVGTVVRVIMGNFKDLTGICVKMIKDKVVINTTLLSREIKVTLPIELIEVPD